MLSITNHVGTFIFIMLIYIICGMYTSYNKQLRIGMKKKDIKIRKGLWEGMKAGTFMFCVWELIYWFVLYFFVLN
jgi:hypothetical protein